MARLPAANAQEVFDSFRNPANIAVFAQISG